MTKTEQNYAVAYFCGYRWAEYEVCAEGYTPQRFVRFLPPSAVSSRIIREWTEAQAQYDGLPCRQGWHAPDYTADRDAIVGAISKLEGDDAAICSLELAALLSPGWGMTYTRPKPPVGLGCWSFNGHIIRQCVTAKPAQLCEALCRTLHPERWEKP